MAKVQITTEKNTGVKALWFNCPGCDQWHRVPVTGPNKWTWNGSDESPTLRPSVKCAWTYGENDEKRCCHFFLKEGKIQFCGDCTHDLKGQTVEMPEFDW